MACNTIQYQPDGSASCTRASDGATTSIPAGSGQQAALTAFFGSPQNTPDPTYVTTADLQAAAASNLAIMAATIPPLASSAPPPVSIASATGSASATARADHTHKSSVQRQYVSVPLTGSTGKGQVTFGQPYDSGVVPIVITEAETPDQTGYTYLSSVVAGSITNTGFQVMVRKLNASVTLPGVATALLNYVVGIFGLATGAVSVRYIAAPATT